MRNKPTDIQRLMGVFMKYAIENGSGAMIYIPSFINIGPGIQKLIRGIHRHEGWHKPARHVAEKKTLCSALEK
jgi:hypothetical protein